MNASLHPPLPTVIVTSLLAASNVKSLPGGPLKLLACLTWAFHTPVPAVHGAVAVRLNDRDAPGASERFRSWRTLATTVPGAGFVIVNPVGGVRLAEPICCVVDSFRSVRVVSVELPSATADGDTSSV